MNPKVGDLTLPNVSNKTNKTNNKVIVIMTVWNQRKDRLTDQRSTESRNKPSHQFSSVQSSPVTQSESLNSDTNYLELVQTPEVKGLDPQDCLRCKS